MAISKSTGIMIVVGLLVLAAAGYLLLRDKGGSAITASALPSSAAEVEFLSLTQKIDPVAIDTDILNDPRFRKLIDIRIDIVPEATGRTDPFAPLSGL